MASWRSRTTATTFCEGDWVSTLSRTALEVSTQSFLLSYPMTGHLGGGGGGGDCRSSCRFYQRFPSHNNCLALLAASGRKGTLGMLRVSFSLAETSVCILFFSSLSSLLLFFSLLLPFFLFHFHFLYQRHLSFLAEGIGLLANLQPLNTHLRRVEMDG